MLFGYALMLLAEVTDPSLLKILNSMDQEHLGKGPHTLVISDSGTMTKIEYKTGVSCLKARNEIRRQIQPNVFPKPIVSAPPKVTVFCVPR